MDGNFEDVAISTFKSSLPTEHGLRKSLTGKPVTNLANSWTVLTSIRGSRKTSKWVKERIRLSLRKEGFQV